MEGATVVTRTFEVTGEYSSPADFEEHLYKTFAAHTGGEKSLTIIGQQVNLDELAEKRGDGPHRVEFELRIHEIIIGTEGKLIFVAGQHRGTHQWVQLEVEGDNIRFTLL